MAGWADVLNEAQPALCTLQLAATAGRTWTWTFVVNDGSGTPVPWATLAVTGTFAMVNWSGVAITSPVTVTFNDSGAIVMSAPNTATSIPPGVYRIELVVTNGAESISVCTSQTSVLSVGV